MIVLVARDDVEGHAPELLLGSFGAEAESADDRERLLIGVGAGLGEVQVRERGQRLHVALAAALIAVEAPGHEVPPAVLFQQPAFAHLDAGGTGHVRVGELDGAVALRVGEDLAGLIAGDAVELQQPVLEARAERQLAGAHLLG